MSRGRWAGWLFVAAGCITLLNAALPGGTHVNHAVLAVMGAVAVAVGAVKLRLPWNSWPASASLVLAVLALALVAIANSFDDSSPYSYSVYYVLVFAWVGLFHPRWTSLRLAPVAGAAYVLPLLFAPGRDSAAVVTVAETLPVSIVGAEVIDRAAEDLRREPLKLAGSATLTRSSAPSPSCRPACSGSRPPPCSSITASGSLVPVATFGWPDAWPLAEFSPNEGDVDRVIRTRHPVLLDRDIPALPLLSLSDVLGVVLVWPALSLDDFALHLAHVLGDQAGQALERTGLVQRLRERTLVDPVTGFGSERRAAQMLAAMPAGDAIVLIEVLPGTDPSLAEVAAYVRPRRRDGDAMARWRGRRLVILPKTAEGWAMVAERLITGWPERRSRARVRTGGAVHGLAASAAATVRAAEARLVGGDPSADDLGDLPGADAGGAHVDAAWRPVDQSPDALDVGIPPPLRPPV